jgi:hypothetical protein
VFSPRATRQRFKVNLLYKDAWKNTPYGSRRVPLATTFEMIFRHKKKNVIWQERP